MQNKKIGPRYSRSSKRNPKSHTVNNKTVRSSCVIPASSLINLSATYSRVLGGYTYTMHCSNEIMKSVESIAYRLGQTVEAVITEIYGAVRIVLSEVGVTKLMKRVTPEKVSLPFGGFGDANFKFRLRAGVGGSVILF